jgi:hypothetical protein
MIDTILSDDAIPTSPPITDGSNGPLEETLYTYNNYLDDQSREMANCEVLIAIAEFNEDGTAISNQFMACYDGKAFEATECQRQYV